MTLDEANEAIADLKFFPFGTGHDGSFYVEEDDDGKLMLCMAKLGFDSRSWVFADDDPGVYDANVDAENLHTQVFTLRIYVDDLTSEERLLTKVCELVGYAMAHEGLEWLRRFDGTLVHDPHIDGDVSVHIQ